MLLGFDTVAGNNTVGVLVGYWIILRRGINYWG
jgi:hypothetical protein